ncbi:hypothetical protein [Chryseobacterium sp. R2A-55]|uniref:hypothetical protein n=1 Tax=Chryseobacterium sp. R2A-55 TaxID=2744445 RepID=UPI001F45DDC6|nr:hypothetical protein [Chryseobacterium sp. R2A-55]
MANHILSSGQAVPGFCRPLQPYPDMGTTTSILARLCSAKKPSGGPNVKSIRFILMISRTR